MGAFTKRQLKLIRDMAGSMGLSSEEAVALCTKEYHAQRAKLDEMTQDQYEEEGKKILGECHNFNDYPLLAPYIERLKKEFKIPEIWE